MELGVREEGGDYISKSSLACGAEFMEFEVREEGGDYISKSLETFANSNRPGRTCTDVWTGPDQDLARII